MNRPRVCFYAPVQSPEILDRVLFYRQDLDALRRLGYDVVVATRWHEVRVDVDLIYVWWWTWAFVPFLVRAWRRTPIVVTGVFDYAWPEPGNDYVHRPRWQQWLMRLGLRQAAANIFLTQFEYRQVTEALPVTHPAIVPLAVDVETYAPSRVPREAALIASIGWLHDENARRKGMFVLLRAFALVHAARPDATLVIAGAPGTATPALEALRDELGLAAAVRFAGAVSDEEKLALLQRCRVYAQPTMFEGFGLAIAEALSCGAPVVTCAGGAVREVVGDAGLLVTRTPEAVAAGILAIVEDSELAGRLTQAGRRRALERFGFERKVTQLGDVLDRARSPVTEGAGRA